MTKTLEDRPEQALWRGTWREWFSLSSHQSTVLYLSVVLRCRGLFALIRSTGTSSMRWLLKGRSSAHMTGEVRQHAKDLSYCRSREAIHTTEVMTASRSKSRRTLPTPDLSFQRDAVAFPARWVLHRPFLKSKTGTPAYKISAHPVMLASIFPST